LKWRRLSVEEIIVKWRRLSDEKVIVKWKILPDEEVIVKWRRLPDDEINDPYSSKNIIRMIKSRRRRWVGHVARIRERRSVYRKRDYVEDSGIDERIIFKYILRKWDGGVDWIALVRIGTSGGLLWMR
jgi:hypothetical protein